MVTAVPCMWLHLSACQEAEQMQSRPHLSTFWNSTEIQGLQTRQFKPRACLGLACWGEEGRDTYRF